MRTKRNIILSLILCFLMALSVLPAAAETEKTTPESTGKDVYNDKPLSVGENDFSIPVNGGTVYRPFTPSEDGYYRIYSSGNGDTYAVMEDISGFQLAYDDDSGDGLNFSILCQLTAGTTYYLGVRYYDGTTSGTIRVTIKQFPQNACGDNLTWSFNAGTGTLSITGTGSMWYFGRGMAPWYDAYGDQIRKITLANGVTSIGKFAFTQLTALTEVTLPDGLLSIGPDAFSYCWALKSVTLPEGLDWLGDWAFYDSGLKSVKIPASVCDIGACAFTGCSDMTPASFSVAADNPYYKAQDGALLSKDGTVFYWYLDYTGRTQYTVPATVTRIESDAFRDCWLLNDVTLQDGLITIDPRAFEYCEGLKTITIPTSVRDVGYGAFYDCYALTDVYYLGTYSERNANLTIDADYGENDLLLNATWHYTDDVEPVVFDGTIEWNKNDVEFKGTTPYVIANGEEQEPRFTVKDAAGNVVDPEYYYYNYVENINAGTGYVIVSMMGGGYEGELIGWFKIYLPATKHTYVENVQDGIRVTWDPVEGAAGYVIYRRAWNVQSAGWTAFARWDNTTETSYLDGHDDAHRVYAGTRYQYGVKAYFAQRRDPISGVWIGGNVGDNYNLGIVGPLKTTVRITTRELQKLVAGSKKITATWSASKNFTGYQIQYATDAAFTKNAKDVKITDPKTNSKALTSLTNGTLYYVRVRSYHEFEGMTYFGGWSNVLCVKPGSGQTVTPSSVTYRAICVGENAYTSGASALYGCINDATSMTGMLKGLSNAFSVTTLTDASSTQILDAIRTLANNAKDGDVSLFSFSGHGNTSGIYCVNGKTITFSTLATELGKVKGRVIIILDCCQSGASIGKGAGFDPDAFNRAAIEAFSGYDLDTGSRTRSGELKKEKFIVITAAHSSEYSYDGGFDNSGYSQGAFTAALIKGMGCKYPNGAYSGTTPADKNGDKTVTLKELYDSIIATVSSWSVPQTAQYYGTDSEVLFRR